MLWLSQALEKLSISIFSMTVLIYVSSYIFGPQALHIGIGPQQFFSLLLALFMVLIFPAMLILLSQVITIRSNAKWFKGRDRLKRIDSQMPNLVKIGLFVLWGNIGVMILTMPEQYPQTVSEEVMVVRQNNLLSAVILFFWLLAWGRFRASRIIKEADKGA